MALFKHEPFGLDISDLSIQVLQLNKKRKVTSANYSEIDSGIIENGKVLNQSALVEAIVKAVDTAKPKPPKTTDVIASLPDSQLFTQVCNIKHEPNTKGFEKALEEEASADIPLDMSDLYADYHVLHEGTDKQEVLFVGVPKETVDEYTSILAASGLRPIALVMESGCLGRCLLPSDFSGSSSVIIVDVGARTTIISIFIPEGIYFSMNVTVAGNEFSRKIADELKIKFPEADKLKIKYGVAEKDDKLGVGKIIKAELEPIMKGIKEAISYHKFKLGQEPNKVLVVGGTSKMTGLMSYMKQQLNREVEIGNTDKRPMSTAYGLALRGISDDPRADGINLLPSA